MKDITKLAEIAESGLSREIDGASNDLIKTLSKAQITSSRYDSFHYLQKLPKQIQSYRAIRDVLVDCGLDVHLYDDKIASLSSNWMNGTPLTKEGIEECLPPDLKEDYKCFCDYQEKQFAEWDKEPQI